VEEYVLCLQHSHLAGLANILCGAYIFYVWHL